MEVSSIIYNADMRVGEIQQFYLLRDDGQSLMRAAMTQLNLSTRAYDRTRNWRARLQIWRGVKKSNPCT